MKAENTTKIQFDSLSVNESYARGAAAAFLARYDPTVPQLADIKTAVSEAVTNCIVHAYPQIRASASRISRRPWNRCLPPETRRNAPGWALR